MSVIRSGCGLVRYGCDDCGVGPWFATDGDSHADFLWHRHLSHGAPEPEIPYPRTAAQLAAQALTTEGGQQDPDA